MQLHIGDVGNLESNLIPNFGRELGEIELVRIDHDRICGIGPCDHMGDNLDTFVRLALVRNYFGALGYAIAVSFGRENDFKCGAVTDSKDIFFKRCLRAASARHYLYNL